MKTFAIAVAVLLSCSLTGCSGGEDKKPEANTSAPPSTAPATALVEGRLVTVGGPAPGDPHPISGTVTFADANGGLTKVPVDTTGKFAIGLYPGSYEIHGTSPNLDRGKMLCSTAKRLTKLTVGKTVTVDVICSIR